MRYYENRTGLTISGIKDVGQVILVNSSNCIIERLDISDSYYAVMLDSSSNNNIHNNKFKNNYYGIYLVESTNNIIWNNCFFNNTEHATGDINSNQWYYGATGNYWSDYTEKYPSATNNGRVWNTPYHIGDITDPFPLVLCTVNNDVNEADTETFGSCILKIWPYILIGIIIMTLFKTYKSKKRKKKSRSGKSAKQKSSFKMS